MDIQASPRKPMRPRPPILSRTSVEEEEHAVPLAAAPPVPPPPRRPPTLGGLTRGRSAYVGPPRSLLWISLGVILLVSMLGVLLWVLTHMAGIW